MNKQLLESIDNFIGDVIDESMLEPGAGIKDSEYNNFSTGLKRIQFRLAKANTAQKYVDAFSVVQQLIERFPLKSALVWKTVTDSYQIRFASGAASDLEA